MNTLRTQMDKNGRILIPANLRKKHDIKPGDNVMLQSDQEAIRILNVDTIVDEARELFCKYKPPDKNALNNFLMEKREEFKIEERRAKTNDERS